MSKSRIAQLKQILNNYLTDDNDIVGAVKAIVDSYETHKVANQEISTALNNLLSFPKLKELIVPGASPAEIIKQSELLLKNLNSQNNLIQQLISLRLPNVNIQEKSLYDAVKCIIDRLSLENTCRRELEEHVSKISGKIPNAEDLIKARTFLDHLRWTANALIPNDHEFNSKLISRLADQYDEHILKILDSEEIANEEDNSDIR